MEVYIYDSVRTPRNWKRQRFFGSGQSSSIINYFDRLKERNDLDTSLVEDLIVGCVTQAGEQGGNVAKSLRSVLLWRSPLCRFLNRYCASGLEANQAAAMIKSGWSEIIAGGVESMSRVPMGIDGSAWLMEPDAAFGHFVPQGISI
jgi:acetyl-CoA C-acetyltransferase